MYAAAWQLQLLSRLCTQGAEATVELWIREDGAAAVALKLGLTRTLWAREWRAWTSLSLGPHPNLLPFVGYVPKVPGATSPAQDGLAFMAATCSLADAL